MIVTKYESIITMHNFLYACLKSYRGYYYKNLYDKYRDNPLENLLKEYVVKYEKKIY